MFDLYIERSPAVFKAAVMLEECGYDYTCAHVSVTRGDQHDPDFRAMSPNGKVPLLVDHQPAGGGEKVTVFDSGAILIYLAEKSGRFLSDDLRVRTRTFQWLFWQASGLSPFGGQVIHFQRFAPEHTREYGLLRYLGEVRRHFSVLDQHLEGRDYIAGDYSIADIGCHGWVEMFDRFELDLKEWPNLHRWWKAIAKRPAVRAAYDRVHGAQTPVKVTDSEWMQNMFGEKAAGVMSAPMRYVPKPKVLD